MGGVDIYGFDESITIFNRVMDEKTGLDGYIHTIIHGCSWFSKHNTENNGASFVRENVHKVRIPNNAKCDKAFSPTHEFVDPTKQYTLRNGDIVARGAFNRNIVKQSELEDMTAHWGIIKATHDNRRVLPAHIYVEVVG